MDLNYEETEEVLQSYIEFYECLEGKKALGDSAEELANEKKESAKLLGPIREATNSLRRLKGEKKELDKNLEEEVRESKKAVMEELKRRNERDELAESRKALRLDDRGIHSTSTTFSTITINAQKETQVQWSANRRTVLKNWCSNKTIGNPQKLEESRSKKEKGKGEISCTRSGSNDQSSGHSCYTNRLECWLGGKYSGRKTWVSDGDTLALGGKQERREDSLFGSCLSPE
ncbi:hypothetical protein DFH27DRAFT_615665 [Peziza echinospora]|nr:hypothetical protein DFH27DRAFT_615665 [Peziza echinospora]